LIDLKSLFEKIRMICGMNRFAMKAENREMMLGKGDGYVLLSTQQARSSKLHLPANHICQRTGI